MGANEQVRVSLLAPRKLLSALAVVLLLSGWWVFLRPTILGGDTTLVTVSGTSMQPGMYTGDLAIVRKTGKYAVGEVIAYHPAHGGEESAQVVIHRIIGGNAESGFIVRGDNNDFDDPWHPRPNQIVGELWLHVPNVGTAIAAMGDPLLAATSFAALTVFVVIVGGGRKDEEDRNEAAEPSETGVSE